MQKDICISLDYTNLIFQRNSDAKASIYPITYQTLQGKYKVCMGNQLAENTCGGLDCHVCSAATIKEAPCGLESHWCLPGPTDDFALIAIASTLSRNNYHLKDVIKEIK